MEDNENKIFEENTYWPQTLGDEAVGKKIDILHTSNPTETASVIAEKEKKIYDRPAEAFKILPEDLSEVYVGTETQLELVPIVDEGDEAPNAPTVVWESSDLNVAFVGDGNILGALSEGSATITATDINNPEVTPVSKEVTVLIFGKKYAFTITFKDGDTIISSVSGVSGTPVSTPGEMEKEGFTFSGWSIDGENVTMPVSNIGDSDITYIAVWEEVVVPETEYTITFRNGDSVVKTITGATGTPVELPTGLSKEGYVLGGWSIDGENIIIPISNIGDSDITYIAVWISYLTEPLTFKITNSGVINIDYSESEDNSLEYKLNNDEWVSVANSTELSVNSGDTVQFRGDNSIAEDSNVTRLFANSTAGFEAEGNIMSLLYKTGFESSISLAHVFEFQAIFSHCAGLSSAENLQLPAIELAENCYDGMFEDCTNLTTAPELPATTLANYCYQCMFSGCSSLISAPELSATTLDRECYYSMFEGCTSLTSAPELPATTLASGCYYYMFEGCTSLTSAPALPATTLADLCYSNMFRGCTSLTIAPELPATTLASGCYYYMFEGCRSLTTAPELPATTLAASCYSSMFEYCTSLTTAPELPATKLERWCYSDMFLCCTSLTTAPELLATKLERECYASMFSNCSNLNYIKCLATDISEIASTSGWVRNVASTGTFVKNASMADWTTGPAGIPSGWTVEEAYMVTFKDGNNIIKVAAGGTGTEVSRPANLEKEGYVFEGWSIDGENTVTPASTIGSSDVTYFAVWSVAESQYASEYFNITVLSAGTRDDVPRILPSNPETYYYSYDKETWTSFDNPLNIHDGDIIYFKGNGGTNNRVKGLFMGKGWSEVNPYEDMELKISGNILSLVYSDNFYNATFETCPNFNYFFSFEGTIVDASDLVLPSKVSSGCFSNMFDTCVRLETPPSVLPAMTLAEDCYSYMFRGCGEMTTVPILPATTLASSCYSGMFSGCSSITTAPELPATTLVEGCYSEMFYGCTNLSYIKCLAIGEFGENATDSWVYYVNNTGTFVVNENSTYDDFQWEEGNDGVPYGWDIVFPDGTPVSGGSSTDSTST